jgi:Kef-type K+ transport system membrane component KefB
MSRSHLVYPVVLLLSILAVGVMLRVGEQRLDRSAPAARSTQPAPSAAAHLDTAEPQGVVDTWRRNLEHPLSRLILQLIVIVVVARVFGYAAKYIGQPPVIGEIAAGLALGPSLLGFMAPEISGFIFPDSSLGVLQLLSQVGVILFMFVIGLELDVAHVRSKATAVIAVSHFSIVVPFLLGVALSLALYERYAPPGTPVHAFGLFMGIAMSITAFPVLARILDERGLTRTPLGATVITCAAVDDVTAWTLLAFVVAIVSAGGALPLLGATIGLAATFTVSMIFLVRPFLARWLPPNGEGDSLTKERIALVLGIVFSAALITELIGIHALFGAFVAGAVMPDRPAFREALRDRLESFSSVFLLPLFFAFTGLRTQVGLLNDQTAWFVCAGIIAAAALGKLGGSMVSARWTGMHWNDAFVLGALMNTRGLMELIALNVGYDLGILSPEIFTMMVLMALVTTAMAGPLVGLALTLKGTQAPSAALAHDDVRRVRL